MKLKDIRKVLTFDATNESATLDDETECFCIYDWCSYGLSKTDTDNINECFNRKDKETIFNEYYDNKKYTDCFLKNIWVYEKCGKKRFLGTVLFGKDTFDVIDEVPIDTYYGDEDM